MLSTIGEPMRNPYWYQLPWLALGLLGSYFILKEFRRRFVPESAARAFFAGTFIPLPGIFVASMFLNAILWGRLHCFNRFLSFSVFIIVFTVLSGITGLIGVGIHGIFLKVRR